MPHFYGPVIRTREQQLVATSMECIQTPHTSEEQEKAHYQENVNKGIKKFHTNNPFKTILDGQSGTAAGSCLSFFDFPLLSSFHHYSILIIITP
jgi:hypothetical protein